MLNVQFSDATEATIVSYFASPQDVATFPNQGQVEASDPRWTSYCGALPSMAAVFVPSPA